MKHFLKVSALAALVSGTVPAGATAGALATANNGDMIRMQSLTPEFDAAHPDIRANRVTLEANVPGPSPGAR